MSPAKKNLLALIAVCLTITGLWYTSRSVAPKDVSWQDVVSEATAGGYRLISTDDLWEKYTDPGTRPLMIDTRQEWEFRTGHMKGAVNFPMEPTWLSRWQNRGPLKNFLGPDKERLIVFY